MNRAIHLPIQFLSYVGRKGIVALVRGYQCVISPWLGPTCRFRPTCSEYFILSVQKHGVLRGGWHGVCRIAKCHPWHPGGYDPPRE